MGKGASKGKKPEEAPKTEGESSAPAEEGAAAAPATDQPKDEGTKTEQAEASGGGDKPEEAPKEEEKEGDAKEEEPKAATEEAAKEDEGAQGSDEAAKPEESEETAKTEEEDKEEKDGQELSRPPGAPDVTDEDAEEKKATINWSKGGEEVKVSGNWNDWEVTAMEKADDGTFSLEISVKPGKYTYRFNVDGDMKHDEDLPSGEGDAGQTVNILTVE